MYLIIFIIMKTMCPSGYHHNSFAATDAFEHIIYNDNTYNAYNIYDI